eukprot:jgi/Tetstr1/442121/TSEL_030276.t1
MHQRSISSLISSGETQKSPADRGYGNAGNPAFPVPIISGRTLGPSAFHNPNEGVASGGSTFYTAMAGISSDSVVVKEFHEALMRSPDMAVAVSAIKALTAVMKKSEAATMMGLERELRDAANSLTRCNPTAISLQAGCELFLRFVTRTAAHSLESENFDVCKERLIERGNQFTETSVRARQTIAELGGRFILPNMTVLCHGFSRVVFTLLQRCVSKGTQFSVIVTEGRPDSTGINMARQLEKLGVPVTIVLDSGVAYIMERVDMVLMGAEGVVESGGIINKLGTYQISLCAAALNKPFYVAAESYKFARLYPLNQRDYPMDPKHVDFGPLLPKTTLIDNPSADYTPPSYIKLLFTDLGVLTPAAVSDELIQLYL